MCIDHEGCCYCPGAWYNVRLNLLNPSCSVGVSVGKSVECHGVNDYSTVRYTLNESGGCRHRDNRVVVPCARSECKHGLTEVPNCVRNVNPRSYIHVDPV